MYALAAVSQITGVPVETIQIWEKRYGLAPQRPAGTGPRRYTDAQVRLVAAVASLVELGHSSDEAVAEVKSRLRRGVSLFDPAAATPGRSLGSPPHPLTQAVLARAEARIKAGVRDTVREAWRLFGPDSVADQWVMPTLRAAGSAWEAGELSVAAEHMVSLEIRGALERDLELALQEPDLAVPVVVVGNAAGVTHDIGAWAFAALTARRGRATRCLGGDKPDEQWNLVLAATTPGDVVLTATRLADILPTERLVARLRAEYPGMRIWIGGRQQYALSGTAPALGDHLAKAAERLASAVTLAR